ncbi:unnamed protein product [Prunus brigantina]
MTAMMQWQVNRQFRKDREAAMARIPNPDAVTRKDRSQSIPSTRKRRRGGRGRRNNPCPEEREGHREEVLPMPYRAEPMIDYAQPEQGRNHHPINALNDVGALQRMIREMMEPEARRGERPTYRKPYPAYIDQIPLPPVFQSTRLHSVQWRGSPRFIG